MARFRKRPVEIDAWRVGSRDKAPEWLTAAIQRGDIAPHEHRVDQLAIETLEGRMLARPGDWIIRGVLGELYPCKPGVFALTYEAVDPVAGPSNPTADALVAGPPTPTAAGLLSAGPSTPTGAG